MSDTSSPLNVALIGLSEQENKNMNHPNLKIPSNIFNSKELNNRLHGNNELIINVLKDFLETIDPQYAKLENSIKIKDLQQIISNAHNLKGAASTIGCIRLSFLSSEIEIAGKISDFEKIKSISTQLETCVRDTKLEIKTQIKIIQSIDLNSP